MKVVVHVKIREYCVGVLKWHVWKSYYIKQSVFLQKNALFWHFFALFRENDVKLKDLLPKCNFNVNSLNLEGL